MTEGVTRVVTGPLCSTPISRGSAASAVVADVLIEVAGRADRRASRPASPRERAMRLRGRHAARARQRALARVPARAARAHAARRRQLLDVAGGHVRARGAAHARRHATRWPRAPTREMVRAGITCVGEFDYVHHSEALIAAARRGRHPAHAARRVLPRGRVRRAAQRRPGALQRRRRRALGGAGLGRSRARRSAPRSTPSARCRRDQMDTVVEWARGQAAALPRLRAARRERGVPRRPRRHAGPAAGRARRARARTRPPSTPPTSPTPTARCCSETTICMCPTTERDLADGIGDAGPEPQPRQRQPRDHRPLRGGARGRAQPAAEDRAPRPLHGAGAAARRDQPRAASAGPTRAGSSPARSPTSSRSASTRRGWRPPSPTRCSSRSCSPPPPPTSPSVLIGGRPC